METPDLEKYVVIVDMLIDSVAAKRICKHPDFSVPMSLFDIFEIFQYKDSSLLPIAFEQFATFCYSKDLANSRSEAIGNKILSELIKIQRDRNYQKRKRSK